MTIAHNRFQRGAVALAVAFAILTPSIAGSQSAARATGSGKTIDVKMIGDGTGYRFEPATVTVKAGDTVRWILVSGPPHNVAFWSDSVPKAAVVRLGRNMPKPMGPLMGPMFMKAGDSYSISFAGLPAGVYRYNCTPHMALGMKAVVRVE
jgi:plastocyanin